MAPLISKIARVILEARQNTGNDNSKWFFRCQLANTGADGIVSLPVIGWTDAYVVLNLNATSEEELPIVIDAESMVWAMPDYNCVPLSPYIGPIYSE